MARWPRMALQLHWLLLWSFQFNVWGTWFCWACELFDDHQEHDPIHTILSDDPRHFHNTKDNGLLIEEPLLGSSASLRRHLQSDGSTTTTSTAADDSEVCGASEATFAEQQADAGLMERWQSLEGRTELPPGSYTIPLYFHVIHLANETNPISATRLQLYLDYLNAAFQDTVFYFDFRETTYSYNTQWATEARVSSVETEFKSLLRRGSTESVNVYVVHSLLPPPGATQQLAPWAGFSYLPHTSAARNGPKDGVVIAEPRGNDQDKRRPNTLVHEVGHFLGLMHTHAGGCDASKQGDAVDDTPASTGGRSTCSNTCCTGDNLDTCPALPGLDPVDNYMSYAGDNLCRVRFTTGQKDRMRAQYELYRKPPETPTQPVIPAPTPMAPPTPAPTECSGWDALLGLCDPPVPAPVDSSGGPPVAAPVDSCGSGWLESCETRDDCCTGNCSPLFCFSFLFAPYCSLLDWCAIVGALFGPPGPAASDNTGDYN